MENEYDYNGPRTRSRTGSTPKKSETPLKLENRRKTLKFPECETYESPRRGRRSQSVMGEGVNKETVDSPRRGRRSQSVLAEMQSENKLTTPKKRLTRQSSITAESSPLISMESSITSKLASIPEDKSDISQINSAIKENINNVYERKSLTPKKLSTPSKESSGADSSKQETRDSKILPTTSNSRNLVLSKKSLNEKEIKELECSSNISKVSQAKTSMSPTTNLREYKNIFKDIKDVNKNDLVTDNLLDCKIILNENPISNVELQMVKKILGNIEENALKGTDMSLIEEKLDAAGSVEKRKRRSIMSAEKLNVEEEQFLINFQKTMFESNLSNQDSITPVKESYSTEFGSDTSSILETYSPIAKNSHVLTNCKLPIIIEDCELLGNSNDLNSSNSSIKKGSNTELETLKQIKPKIASNASVKSPKFIGVSDKLTTNEISALPIKKEKDNEQRNLKSQNLEKDKIKDSCKNNKKSIGKNKSKEEVSNDEIHCVESNDFEKEREEDYDIDDNILKKTEEFVKKKKHSSITLFNEKEEEEAIDPFASEIDSTNFGYKQKLEILEDITLEEKPKSHERITDDVFNKDIVHNLQNDKEIIDCKSKIDELSSHESKNSGIATKPHKNCKQNFSFNIESENEKPNSSIHDLSLVEVQNTSQNETKSNDKIIDHTLNINMLSNNKKKLNNEENAHQKEKNKSFISFDDKAEEDEEPVEIVSATETSLRGKNILDNEKNKRQKAKNKSCIFLDDEDEEPIDQGSLIDTSNDEQEVDSQENTCQKRKNKSCIFLDDEAEEGEEPIDQGSLIDTSNDEQVDSEEDASQKRKKKSFIFLDDEAEEGEEPIDQGSLIDTSNDEKVDSEEDTSQKGKKKSWIFLDDEAEEDQGSDTSSHQSEVEESEEIIDKLSNNKKISKMQNRLQVLNKQEELFYSQNESDKEDDFINDDSLNEDKEECKENITKKSRVVNKKLHSNSNSEDDISKINFGKKHAKHLIDVSNEPTKKKLKSDTFLSYLLNDNLYSDTSPYNSSSDVDFSPGNIQLSSQSSLIGQTRKGTKYHSSFIDKITRENTTKIQGKVKKKENKTENSGTNLDVEDGELVTKIYNNGIMINNFICKESNMNEIFEVKSNGKHHSAWKICTMNTLLKSSPKSRIGHYNGQVLRNSFKVTTTKLLGKRKLNTPNKQLNIEDETICSEREISLKRQKLNNDVDDTNSVKVKEQTESTDFAAFITNLPIRTVAMTIKIAFNNHNITDLESIDLSKCPKSKFTENRGFGSVKFSNEQTLREAVMLSGKLTINGFPITITPDKNFIPTSSSSIKWLLNVLHSRINNLQKEVYACQKVPSKTSVHEEQEIVHNIFSKHYEPNKIRGRGGYRGNWKNRTARGGLATKYSSDVKM